MKRQNEKRTSPASTDSHNILPRSVSLALHLGRLSVLPAAQRPCPGHSEGMNGCGDCMAHEARGEAQGHFKDVWDGLPGSAGLHFQLFGVGD